MHRGHRAQRTGEGASTDGARACSRIDRPDGLVVLFFFQAEDGIRDLTVTGVQACALPICLGEAVGVDLDLACELGERAGPLDPAVVDPRLREATRQAVAHGAQSETAPERSEEHTSELQSQSNLVCRLLLEKKKIYTSRITYPNTPNSSPYLPSVSEDLRASATASAALCCTSTALDQPTSAPAHFSSSLLGL